MFNLAITTKCFRLIIRITLNSSAAVIFLVFSWNEAESKIKRFFVIDNQEVLEGVEKFVYQHIERCECELNELVEL